MMNDTTKSLPGENFAPWPPLMKMDEAVKAKMEKLLDAWRREEARIGSGLLREPFDALGKTRREWLKRVLFVVVPENRVIATLF